MTENVIDRIRGTVETLAPAARRVAHFIAEKPANTLAMSAAELGAAVDTSDATVIRVVQSLGFSGLPELKRALADCLSGRPGNADDMRRTLSETGEDPANAVKAVFDAHQEAFEKISSAEIRRKVIKSIEVLHEAHRIHVFGIGPSSFLAQYVAFYLQRIGRRASSVTSTGTGLADALLGMKHGDALLMMAYGRPYREAKATLAEANALKMPRVLITDDPKGPLARSAEVVIPAHRGRSRRAALHGATLVLLESIILGLTALEGTSAPASLDRLNRLRFAITGA